MAKYICKVCGYIYDTEVGLPDIGIDPGTPFKDLPDDFNCPGCAYPKEEFKKME
ncbi:rubredoxin [Dethiothermospora halolimnae]|uniref:rubredoxin n=1 Tax=Dethiothermospora halolimnae TaxID=3114390 RepID=UPI003CCBE754